MKHSFLMLLPKPLSSILQKAIFVTLKYFFINFRVPVDIAKELSFGQLESTLQKARRKCLPRLPVSAAEFDQMMNEDWHGRFAVTMNGKEFYRTNLKINGNNNLIFVSENTKTLLATATEIHVDGTFKCVPTVPGIKQLFVVMAIAHNHVSRTNVVYVYSIDFKLALIKLLNLSFICYI